MPLLSAPPLSSFLSSGYRSSLAVPGPFIVQYRPCHFDFWSSKPFHSKEHILHASPRGTWNKFTATSCELTSLTDYSTSGGLMQCIWTRMLPTKWWLELELDHMQASLLAQTSSSCRSLDNHPCLAFLRPETSLLHQMPFWAILSCSDLFMKVLIGRLRHDFLYMGYDSVGDCWKLTITWHGRNMRKGCDSNQNLSSVGDLDTWSWSKAKL